MQTIIVTHILPSGTAFGATTTRPTEAVFIPASVSRSTDIVVGQEVEAQLVPNTMQPERTPWFAARLKLKPVSGGSELVNAKVKKVMRDGGVWTAGTMATELGDGTGTAETLTELNAMFNQGLCAKFELWKNPGHMAPAKQWFTCYPDHVEVDEWEEVE
jgi:hypothetical protein